MKTKKQNLTKYFFALMLILLGSSGKSQNLCPIKEKYDLLSRTPLGLHIQIDSNS